MRPFWADALTHGRFQRRQLFYMMPAHYIELKKNLRSKKWSLSLVSGSIDIVTVQEFGRIKRFPLLVEFLFRILFDHFCTETD